MAGEAILGKPPDCWTFIDPQCAETGKSMQIREALQHRTVARFEFLEGDEEPKGLLLFLGEVSPAHSYTGSLTLSETWRRVTGDGKSSIPSSSFSCPTRRGQRSKALHQLILDIQETKEAIAAHTIPGDLICMEKVSMRLGLVALVLLGIMLAASQQAVDASSPTSAISYEGLYRKPEDRPKKGDPVMKARGCTEAMKCNG
uniref:Uncharacterized protein n=1 Tax=Oryza rufipogon TaxID=4529 RepID=A0A0E0RH14_ORYRU